jgi:hypothetical protein
MNDTRFFVGVDLGQVRDFTAIAVLEVAFKVGQWDPVSLAYPKIPVLGLRYLERIPLGTPYPEVVEKVREVTRSAELRGHCQLVVDATGVGVPVADILRKADLECLMYPVMITGGDVETSGNGFYRVPKTDLIVGLQVLFQQKGLKIAGKLPLGRALIEEMAAMRVKVTLSGHEQYETWREGEHDDLVFALALAYWGAKKTRPRELSGAKEWWRWDPDPTLL